MKNRKSSMLEYFWIESLKNKTQPLRNGAADQRKLSKELNENAKETDIKVFMVIIYCPGWGKEGGGEVRRILFV